MHHLACILSLEERESQMAASFKCHPDTWCSFEIIYMFVCVCVHTLNTHFSQHLTGVSLPHEIVNNTVLPEARSDVKEANTHGMWHCRKLPMKLHRAIE